MAEAIEIEQRRKQRLREQTPDLTEMELEQIRQIYDERNSLNEAAGFIKYHVDHIEPLASGGRHHPENLQVINAGDNMRKGAKGLAQLTAQILTQ